MSAHTPGPWTFGLIDGRERLSPIFRIFDEGGVVAKIAMLEDSLGNARLIACAPDLLDALKGYVKVIATAGGGDKDLFMAAIRKADDAARAVIAKAEGTAP